MLVVIFRTLKVIEVKTCFHLATGKRRDTATGHLNHLLWPLLAWAVRPSSSSEVLGFYESVHVFAPWRVVKGFSLNL